MEAIFAGAERGHPEAGRGRASGGGLDPLDEDLGADLLYLEEADSDEQTPDQVRSFRLLFIERDRMELWMLTAGRYFVLSPASLSALSYEHNLSQPVIRLLERRSSGGRVNRPGCSARRCWL
jgi:hypothetical protein